MTASLRDPGPWWLILVAIMVATYCVLTLPGHP